MISLIVPTRNRLYTLELVLASYLNQSLVTEIIFIIDGGNDGTRDMLSRLKNEKSCDVRICVLVNKVRRGAAYCRNLGATQASNDYVLFCDDDEYLEKDYAQVCLAKLGLFGASAVSGRRVYMQAAESPHEAVTRFGNGLEQVPPFDTFRCEYNNDAIFSGDVEMPYTNANILTRKSLVLTFGFDETYVNGDGYREESDFQLNLFTSGHKIVVTNDVHSIHLPLSFVRVGGQRTSAFKRTIWRVLYTRRFLRKYHSLYCARLGLHHRVSFVLANFALKLLWEEMKSFLRRRRLQLYRFLPHGLGT